MTPLTILLSILALLLLLGLIFLIVRVIRVRRLAPSGSTAARQEQLNEDLQKAGFAYDRKQDIFYSLDDCWQREMGYCQLYDEGSSAFNMVMHCEPIRFEYGGKRWLIELWKGQYGITTGAEVGIYNTTEPDIHSSRFTGTFYHCASDEERLPISFVLRRKGRVLIRRSDTHWWLTGFKLGVFSRIKTLTMDVQIQFPNPDMCSAFLNALQDLGYHGRQYSVRGTTVRIRYRKPHSRQPQSRGSLQELTVTGINRANCRLYRTATKGYHNTLDKLEYLQRLAPELYEFCMHSLYARAFYDSFAWLLELVGIKRPQPGKPKPEHPKPEKPCRPGCCQTGRCCPGSCAGCGKPCRTYSYQEQRCSCRSDSCQGQRNARHPDSCQSQRNACRSDSCQGQNNARRSDSCLRQYDANCLDSCTPSRKK